MATKSLEKKIQTALDYMEIQNTMGRYSYLHTAGMHDECVELFAKNTPGLRIEMEWGVYEGADAAYRCYAVDHNLMEGRGEARIGQMHMHTLTTPVIEIAGDGKTAKGVWISPGHESGVRDGKAQASWAWLKYGADFLKQDGKWKIWHLHFYGIFMTPYDKPWTEVEPSRGETLLDVPKRHIDRPPTTDTEYSPTRKLELVPALPEPYETFDEKTAY